MIDVAKVRRVTATSGLVAAILFGAGNALWAFDQPPFGAPTHQILAFYRSDSALIVAGATLSLISFVPFTLFATGLRDVLRGGGADGTDDLLAASALAGGIVLVAAGLGAETINLVGAQRAAAHELTRPLGEAVFEISYVLGYPAAGVGAGIMLLGAGAVFVRGKPIGRQARGISLLVAGICFLTPLARFLVAPAVVLLAVASALLLRAAPTSGDHHR